MSSTLYLNPDGVLGPTVAAWNRWDWHRWSAMLSADATAELERLLMAFPGTTIVLHSLSVKVFGYQAVVQRMPALARACIVGSTCDGNRLVKFCRSRNYSRREWLRADLRRRAPQNPIVIDYDWAQRLPENARWTLIVQSPRGLAAPRTAEALFELFCNAETEAESYKSAQLTEVAVCLPGHHTGGSVR